MNLPGSDRLHRAVRRLQKRFSASSKGLILMYHGIADVNLDPWALHVTPQHFAEHLEVLQKDAHPISLQQLAQAHRDGNIPDRAVAITFDDGYANNLHNAKPLLEQYGIPAMVFVTTGYVGRNREFWWDELERILLQPGKLPKALCLTLNDRIQEWELGAASDYSKGEYESDRDRRAWEAQPGSRLAFFYSVWEQLRPMPEGERLKALDEMTTWANTDSVARLTHRPLLSEELLTLAEGPIVEIGAHTVTHPFLPAYSAALQQDEIQQSQEYLEQLLERPVTNFAYPFGHYTKETLNLVQAAGFSCACSCVAETVWQNSDSFQLPRFDVRNWKGQEFAERLLRWFRT
jgi:peptidoglycan/xylan/chitin deacetylase (PgdA/CDA1 family)